MTQQPKNYIILPIYMDKKLRICVGTDSDVWDNGGRNIKLDQAEFIDMGPLSRDSGYSTRGHKGSNSLFAWLAETWAKMYHTN